MKLEVATWIAFCLYVTGTESLVKSQHTETGGANSRLKKLQPEKKKKSPAPLGLVVFRFFIHNCSHHGIHDLFRESSLSWSSTCVASSSSSVWKKLLILCDCTEECQLRGMMGGRKLYWSQGKTLRDSAVNLQTKYSLKLFYLCSSYIFFLKC